jgi:hypothetical protein
VRLCYGVVQADLHCFTFREKIDALRPIAARAEGRTPSPQI